jgi:hypothetical protein
MGVARSYTGQFLKHNLQGREAMQPADVIAARAKTPQPDAAK